MKNWRFTKFLAGVGTSLVILILLVTSARAAAWDTASVSVDSREAQGQVDQSPSSHFQAGYDAGINSWTRIGPLGGNVLFLVIDPTTPSTLYAGLRTEGVYKSVDGGDNWTAVNNGLNFDGSTVLYSLAIDPNTPSKLYATINKGGLFESTNGGWNWSEVTGNPTVQFRIKGIAPTTPSTIYAGVDRLYKSTNGGRDWDLADTGLPNASGSYMVIDPKTPSTLYIESQYGVYKSTNDGDYWSAANNLGLPTTGHYIDILVIDPVTPSILYAAIGSSGVLKSTNKGDNWIPVNTGLPFLDVDALAIDPTTPSTLYAARGGYGVFKSTNGGDSWSDSNSDLPRTSVNALRVDATTPGTLYAGLSVGVFKSTNDGKNWYAINSAIPGGNDVYSLAVDPKISSTLYAGTVQYGVFKSTNSGKSWSQPRLNLSDVWAIMIDPSTTTTLYAGTSGDGVFKSMDGGDNWSEANTGLDTHKFIRAMVIDPKSPRTLYASTFSYYSLTSHIYKTTNGGDSWSWIAMSDRDVYAMAIDPTTPSTLYAGTSTAGVYKTTNGGVFWNAVNTGLPGNSYVLALAIDPITPGILYAGTRGSGIFKSTNGGESWREINTGLTDYQVNVITIDPTTPSTLYAGTSGYAVFLSTDGGENWREVGSGLTSSAIFAMLIDTVTPTKLFAGGKYGVSVINYLHPFSVSGQVTDAIGNPLSGVTVSDGGGHSTTTDNNGNYSFSGLVEGTYNLTPTKIGFTFLPAARAVAVPPNAAGQDFSALHQPVVFIPGIMGSNLYDDNDTLHWLSFDNINKQSFDPLFLGPDGFSLDCPIRVSAATCNQNAHNGSAGMVLRHPLPFPLNKSVYADLVQHFLDQGYIEGNDTTVGDFWVFNYDWRKDLTLAADKLDDYINTILSKTKATQVVIVAHSMGGLVARQYISNQNRALKIGKLITMGTPYLGTPKAFAVLQGMRCMIDLKIGCLPPSDVASKLAHNFPGTHELLPSRAYFAANGSGYYSNNPINDPSGYCPQCLNYDQTYQTSVATNINPLLISKADTFHQNLDNKTSWNNVPLTVLYGINQPTIFGINKVDTFSWSSLKNISIIEPKTYLNGDGTVTAPSAAMWGLGVLADYQQFKDDHGQLINDPLVHNYIDTVLGLPPLSANVISPQEVSSDPTAAEIVATGVKAIDVTDSAGNHTGPQVGSDIIDEAIPGSLYFSQENLAKVALLGGQSYTITVNPTGLGRVDISLVRMTPSGTSATLLYTGIPASSQSRIRFTGDPYQVNNWQLDMDGSGNQVQAVDPTLSYSGSDSVDYTPPQASIQIEGNVGPEGWFTAPVTVTLSATDNAGGSGVNRIEYAFGNDHTPQLYTEPFSADPNLVSVLYVIATDQAGNRQTIPATARIGPEKNYLPLIRR